jgi:radical SAM superfamily enzyme YgiQ (UPF0313 family)
VRKVLLLNPPGDRLYIRDQFCSHVSKGTYYWQPLDLLMLSARLDADGYELAVVDAIAERLSAEETHARIRRFSPEAVVFLTGSDSFLDDVRFIEETKRRGVEIAVGIGDILREKGERLLMRHHAVDACVNDFVTHGLHAFLQGKLDEAENMTVRSDTAVRKIPALPRPKTFRIPSPRYDLFALDRYRLPFNKYHPYATIITSTWCPYGCSYCPFARTPYRVREVDDVLENLERIRRMGIRQIHIADWTFAVDRRQAKAILQGMIDAKFGFTFSCLSRVDLVDREMLELIKAAGCDLIELGVESGTQELQDRYGKSISLDQVRRAFRWAAALDLPTLATFVLGLPGETHETLEQTLKLALEIDPAYCSFNVASPRMGTRLRREMIGQGLIDDDDHSILDSSRSLPVFSTPELSAEEVLAFQKRAIRTFFLRPSYIARRLKRLGSWIELQNHLGNGISLAWQALQSAKAGRS